MANMLMSHRGRGAAGHPPSCHDVCDPMLAPRVVKIQRRAVKRSEKRIWKKDAKNS